MNQYLLFLVFLVQFHLLTSVQIHHRQKRYLLFPFQGTFKTVLSFAIPWKLGPKQEMGVGWNFQFQYPLPYNTTAFSNYPPTLSRSARDKRDSSEIMSDRAMFYRGVESFLERHDINGKQCLLKTICENADYNHFTDESGLLVQILHVFLTPNNGNGVDPMLDPDYSDAQKAGEFGVDCTSSYPDCNMERSFFNLFSIYEN
ncbi:hypothetical protein ABEB36_005935 [Hypothenemus hampei]|uniref:Uncharacterized protein n=1 Tax=Hypothenemus hampei TaxID=57062 RepID=A0ABD1EZX5_HYPHA